MILMEFLQSCWLLMCDSTMISNFLVLLWTVGNLFCFEMPMLKRSEWVCLTNVSLESQIYETMGSIKINVLYLLFWLLWWNCSWSMIFNKNWGKSLNKFEKYHNIFCFIGGTCSILLHGLLISTKRSLKELWQETTSEIQSFPVKKKKKLHKSIYKIALLRTKNQEILGFLSSF